MIFCILGWYGPCEVPGMIPHPLGWSHGVGVGLETSDCDSPL